MNMNEYKASLERMSKERLKKEFDDVTYPFKKRYKEIKEGKEKDESKKPPRTSGGMRFV